MRIIIGGILMQEKQNLPQKPRKKKRWVGIATAAVTAAAALAIWNLPASQAEKQLKDIDWR
jgi:hypothetical protein